MSQKTIILTKHIHRNIKYTKSMSTENIIFVRKLKLNNLLFIRIKINFVLF